MELINDNWRDDLVKNAEAYCVTHGIMMTTLGGKIAGDADFFLHLKKGGGCTVDKYIKIKHWLTINKSKKHRTN